MKFSRVIGTRPGSKTAKKVSTVFQRNTELRNLRLRFSRDSADPASRPATIARSVPYNNICVIFVIRARALTKGMDFLFLTLRYHNRNNKKKPCTHTGRENYQIKTPSPRGVGVGRHPGFLRSPPPSPRSAPSESPGPRPLFFIIYFPGFMYGFFFFFFPRRPTRIAHIIVWKTDVPHTHTLL